MNNAPDYKELFDEFPELAEPDVVFGKEVLAHFGLLFSNYANLEAGIQICYIRPRRLEIRRMKEIDNVDKKIGNMAKSILNYTKAPIHCLLK